MRRVRLAPTAARQFDKFPDTARTQLRGALRRLSQTDRPRNVNVINGAAEPLERLRVGDYRVMFERLDDDQVILMLGIVHRRDLERWIRSR